MRSYLCLLFPDTDQVVQLPVLSVSWSLLSFLKLVSLWRLPNTKQKSELPEAEFVAASADAWPRYGLTD